MLLFALLCALGAAAAPRTLSSVDLDAFTPYTQFARAAYCPPSLIQGWDCGEACQCNADFQVSLTGGDGDGTQYCTSLVSLLFPSHRLADYVGYWPVNNTVVVAHQGTDPFHILSDFTDLAFFLKPLDCDLFPGIDSDVEVHSGFANEHAKTATIILNQVETLITQHDATSVTLIGHSLGGALAELDCLFMALYLPPQIAIRGITYGTPRVGNAAWAALFDELIPDFVRINNQKDIVPIVPGRHLGYRHVHGEIHLIGSDDAVACSGDDDATDSQCTISTVPNIFAGDLMDHMGPYGPGGIHIGTLYCP